MKKNEKIFAIFTVILVALVTILPILILELSMKDQKLWQRDKILGWKHIPNKTAYQCNEGFCHRFTMNSDGFADDEFSVDKHNEKRIFLFGDSMIEGFYTDTSNSTHRLLEKKLQEINPNIQVYNFGVSDYGTAQYYLTLKKYGPIYKPDIVIFALMIENDIKDVNPALMISDDGRPYIEFTNDKANIIHTNYTEDNPIITLMKKSKFLSYILQSIERFQKWQLELSSTPDNIPLPFYIYQKDHDEFNKSFLINEKIILLAKNLCKNMNSELIIITIAPSHIDETIWAKMLERYPNMKKMEWDLEYPTHRIKDFCEREDLNCLHLLHPFMEYINKTGKVLYSRNHYHWNENGNRLAAEEIYKYLTTNDFI